MPLNGFVGYANCKIATGSTLQERRMSANTMRLMEQLFAAPLSTVPLAAIDLGVSQTGARRIVDSLVSYGVLEEVEGTWPRVYVARELLEAIE